MSHSKKIDRNNWSSWMALPVTHSWSSWMALPVIHSWSRCLVFNAIFNNILVLSWQTILLLEETGENHRPVTSHWQTLSYNVVWSIPRHERGFKQLIKLIKFSVMFVYIVYILKIYMVLGLRFWLIFHNITSGKSE